MNYCHKNKNICEIYKCKLYTGVTVLGEVTGKKVKHIELVTEYNGAQPFLVE